MIKAEDRIPVKDVVLLLESFRTLMNLLGAIGTLTEGSGLKETLETFYGENAVVHMMNGKAVQRALRGHLLVNHCLTNQTLSKIIESEPEFLSLIQELELYTQADSSDLDVNSLLAPDCMERISCAVGSKKPELSNN